VVSFGKKDARCKFEGNINFNGARLKAAATNSNAKEPALPKAGATYRALGGAATVWS
jgi:hypothetical protein